MAGCYGPFNHHIPRVRVWFTSQSQTSHPGCAFPSKITFMDRSSRCSQVAEGVGFHGIIGPLLLFADDVVLLASLRSNSNLCWGGLELSGKWQE